MPKNQATALESPPEPQEAPQALPVALGPSQALQVPDDLLRALKEDMGRGVSQRSEDNVNPMVKLLQANSPEVNAKHASYVEGAEPAAFLLRNSPVPIIPGHVGFPFLPVCMELAWVEWVPRSRGGGFVAKHGAQQPSGLIQIIDPETDKKKWVHRDTRHEFIDTAYRYGFLDLSEYGFGMSPFVIPFTSTGHMARREWETLMNQMKVEGFRGVPPAYKFIYRIKARQRINKNGQVWFVPHATFERESTTEEYFRGRDFYDSWERGQQTVDATEAAPPAEDNEAPF